VMGVARSHSPTVAFFKFVLPGRVSGVYFLLNFVKRE